MSGLEFNGLELSGLKFSGLKFGGLEVRGLECGCDFRDSYGARFVELQTLAASYGRHEQPGFFF